MAAIVTAAEYDLVWAFAYAGPQGGRYVADAFFYLLRTLQPQPGPVFAEWTRRYPGMRVVLEPLHSVEGHIDPPLK